MRRDLATATRVGHLLLDPEELDFLPCSDLFVEILQAFTDQKDTTLSFADAAIACVAEKLANGLVLTLDDEFRKLPGIQVLGPS